MCVLLLLSGTALSKTRTCRSFFQNPPPVINADWDLIWQQQFETRQMTFEQIKQSAQKFLIDLVSYRPPFNVDKARSLMLHQAQKLMTATQQNEVVGFRASQKYQNPKFAIGYCFGRATFIHLMLLKMGVQKESIYKIWAVGGLVTNIPDVVWGHHVATVVFTRDKGWVVLDTNEAKPITVEEWMNSQISRSTDGQIRFYLTDAAKLGVDIGRYSRLQMGLDLPLDQDLYFGYFKDMIQLISKKPLSYFGLKAVTPEKDFDSKKENAEERRTRGFLENLRDFFSR